MGKIIASGISLINGPWFLGLTELEELGKIYEKIDLLILESAEKLSKEKANRHIQEMQRKDSDKKKIYKYFKDDMFSNKKKTVSLIFQDGTRLDDDSLEKIFKDPKLSSLKPVKLYLKIRIYFYYDFSLYISQKDNGELGYEIEFDDSDLKDDVKFLLDKWIDKYRPNKVKQIWNKYSFWFGWVASISVLLLLFMFSKSSESQDSKSFYKNEINEIIKSGINKENEGKAIEILLKIASEYKPEIGKKIRVKDFPIRGFSMCIIILLISIFYPKTTIGIGKNKRRLSFYKNYTKFVLITIPLGIIFPIIIDLIKVFFFNN